MSFDNITSGLGLIGSGVNIAGSIADLFRDGDGGGGSLIPPDPYKGLISTDAYRFGSGALAGTGDMMQQERRLLGLTGDLRGQVAPGFSNLTRTGVDAIREKAGQASGNLRASLAQRGLAGASFANDQVSNVMAQYNQEEDAFRAQAFQAELDATLKTIQQEQSILAQQAERELAELGTAASFLSQVNQTILSQSEALAALASQNIIANLPPLQGGPGGTSTLPPGTGGTGTTPPPGTGGTPGPAQPATGSVAGQQAAGTREQQGGEGGRDNTADTRSLSGAPTGFAPGRQDWLDYAGTAAGLALPGAGMVTSAINAGLSVEAALEQARAMGVDLTAGDWANVLSGGGPFGMFSDASTYATGRGGYGQIGYGGAEGMLNMLDPGVAGAARATASSITNNINPSGGIATPPAGLGAGLSPTGITTPSSPGLAVPGTAIAAAPVAPAPAAPVAPAPAPVSAAQAAAARAALAGSIPQGPGRQAAMAAYDKSVANLSASGNLNASTLSQAGQLAKSGMSMQKGTSGVSGSQIAGGKTVGSNPNDRSGRNPGAPSGAGAGGRLGGGV